MPPRANRSPTDNRFARPSNGASERSIATSTSTSAGCSNSRGHDRVAKRSGPREPRHRPERSDRGGQPDPRLRPGRGRPQHATSAAKTRPPAMPPSCLDRCPVDSVAAVAAPGVGEQRSAKRSTASTRTGIPATCRLAKAEEHPEGRPVSISTRSPPRSATLAVFVEGNSRTQPRRSARDDRPTSDRSGRTPSPASACSCAAPGVPGVTAVWRQGHRLLDPQRRTRPQTAGRRRKGNRIAIAYGLRPRPWRSRAGAGRPCPTTRLQGSRLLARRHADQRLRRRRRPLCTWLKRWSG